MADPGVSRGGASRTINIVLVGNSTEVVLLKRERNIKTSKVPFV